MRHLKRGRHLGRTSSHRQAMLRNMAASLFICQRITTTPEKAKEARPFAERLITLAKRGDLAAKRRAIQLLHDPRAVAELFGVLGPRFKERPGGYTRILHLEKRRVGDSARQVIFELVGDMALPAEYRDKRRPDSVAVAPASSDPVDIAKHGDAMAPTDSAESSEQPIGAEQPADAGSSVDADGAVSGGAAGDGAAGDGSAEAAIPTDSNPADASDAKPDAAAVEAASESVAEAASESVAESAGESVGGAGGDAAAPSGDDDAKAAAAAATD